MKIHHAPGATPLDPDEMEGLKPSHITNQNELNEWEQENIINAETWIFSSTHTYRQILTSEFIQKVHKKMFDETWQWAGKFRHSLKSIGVEPAQIRSELKKLLDDTLYQIEYSIYSIDEIAYRFHHRLVKIHPFANGNGRHARIITDILLISLGQSRFTWGREKLASNGPVRNQYIKALRDADKHDYTTLSQFVRS